MKEKKLQGMKGDVFNLGGKVTGSIPPSCLPNAISFAITRVMPETERFPAWTDMFVDGTVGVRINPGICQSPYFRLFDCVAIIGQKGNELLAMELGKKVEVTFGGQEFIFWVESMQSPFGTMKVIVVDTLERILKWNPQNLQVTDGQNRHGGGNRRK